MTRQLFILIDRLVLRGVDRSDAAAFSAALRTQLHTLLAEPGAAAAWSTPGDTPALHAGRTPVRPAADAASLGHAVAARIVGSRSP